MPISSLVSWRTFARIRASAVFHSDSGVSSGTIAKPGAPEAVDRDDPSFTVAVSGFSQPPSTQKTPSMTYNDEYPVDRSFRYTAKLLLFCHGPLQNLYWLRRDYAGNIACLKSRFFVLATSLAGRAAPSFRRPSPSWSKSAKSTASSPMSKTPPLDPA